MRLQMRLQSTSRLFFALALVSALLLTLSSSPRRAVSARSGSSLSRQSAATFKNKDKDRDEDHKIKPCREQKPKKDKDDRKDDSDDDDDKVKEKDDKKDKDRDDCLPEGGSSGISKGDFNGDGFADLAIGVPNEDVNGFQDAGAVSIIYGTTDGLHQNAVQLNQFWTENNVHPDPGITAFTDNQFGAALAAGNFNGDLFSDLAIGIPLKETKATGATIPDSGMIIVLYGSVNGLTSAGSQFFIQGANLFDAAEKGDRFGSVLSWGDFDEDGFGDLAVGIPDEDDGNIVDAGAVQIIYGTSTGLTTARNQFFTQSSSGIADDSEAGDKFGSTLAGGDFDGDGESDLAIGVPLENVGTISDAGAVNVIYGSLPGEVNAAGGLTSTNNQFWTQNSVQGFTEILDQAEAFDRFGSSLAAGDFDTDFVICTNKCTSDLAIGVPFEDVQLGVSNAVITDAGAVNVIYGSRPGQLTVAGGLTVARNQFWQQDSSGVPGVSEEGDRFGTSLAAGDFDNSGDPRSEDDLAIGAPFEDDGSIVDAGAVTVIYGSVLDHGLSTNTAFATDAQVFSQNTVGVLDTSEEGDRFGSSLTAWDFGKPAPSGRKAADLAIGVPFEDFSGQADAGAVNVLYGISSLDSITPGLNVPGNQFWTQNSPGIADSSNAGDHFGATLY